MKDVVTSALQALESQGFDFTTLTRDSQNRVLADAVTLFYVLEHLSDPIGILKETRRILKPGGVLLLRWPHSTPIVRLLGPLGRKLDLYHTPYHLFDYSPSFLKNTLTNLGFESIRTLIAGNTRPVDRLGRWSSMVCGGLGELLSRVTGGRLLLPGVSKTTCAMKPATPDHTNPL